MQTLFYIILVFIVIRIINFFRIQTITEKASNKLNIIHQNLKLSWINGEINLNNINEFEYLELLISHTEKIISRLNYWVIWYSLIRFKKNNTSKKQFLLEKSLIIKNEKLKIIYEDYTNEFAEFIIKKSIFSLLTTTIMYAFSKWFSSKYKSTMERNRIKFSEKIVLTQESYFKYA